MNIAVVGISYKNSDIDTRGKVAFTTSSKDKITKQLFNKGLAEFVILSTCNRTEIYIASDNIETSIDVIEEVFIQYGESSIKDKLYICRNQNAISHLFEVATGLDSQIVGEDEIINQLKSASNYARDKGSCRKYLDKLIRESISFTKKIKTEYKISENKLSVASLCNEYLENKYPQLYEKSILLIGTGDMGQLILKYLNHDKIGRIYLTNRTRHSKHQVLQLDKKIELIEYTQRYNYLSKVDIVISATSSPHTIIRSDNCPIFQQPITFIDLAVPRDIEAEVANLNNVEIIVLDDLNKIISYNIQIRKEIAEKVKELIRDKVEEMSLWILRSKADRIIELLKNQQEQKTDSNSKEVKRNNMQLLIPIINKLSRINNQEELDNYLLQIEDKYLKGRKSL